jgi:hypothetical protein
MNINKETGIAKGENKNTPVQGNIESKLLKIGFVSYNFKSFYCTVKRSWSWSCDILKKKS